MDAGETHYAQVSAKKKETKISLKYDNCKYYYFTVGALSIY